MPAVLWAAARPRAAYAPAVGAAGPAVLAVPAADARLAERREVQIARDSVAAEPAADVDTAVVVVAPAISAPAVVVNDAPELAAFEFAVARAATEPAAGQPRVVAAVTELFVVWQLLSASAVADASSVDRPADEPVDQPVDLLPGQSHPELFAGPSAVCASPAFAVEHFDRRAQPASPDQPFVVHALGLPPGLAVEPAARRRADLRFEASASSLDHSKPPHVTTGPDHA